VNLHILAKRFTQLSRSAFFDPAFRQFAQRTIDAIYHVLENQARYPDDVVRQFEGQVWRVTQFVSGSRSKDAPHETQYVLKKALRDWISKEVLVSSAALEEFNFFLNTEDVWEFIARSINQFDTEGYQPLVVRIGSPEAYKHRPLFCTPLFHELGHFVDHYFEVSKFSLLLNHPEPLPPNITAAQWQFVNLRHRMEHFADLFGACYCGYASNKSLLAIAPSNGDSPTHPATFRRVAVVDDFLQGRANSAVDILQDACERRTGKRLVPRFRLPNLASSFNEVLTYRIQGDDELYGMFSAGWDYLHDQITFKTAPWIEVGTGVPEIEKTINDLVEKSIRNFEIRERWDDGVAN
jgi:hypothetical protein